MECTLVKSELLDDHNYIVTIRRRDGSEVRLMIPREDSQNSYERECMELCSDAVAQDLVFGLNLVSEGHYT